MLNHRPTAHKNKQVIEQKNDKNFVIHLVFDYLENIKQ